MLLGVTVNWEAVGAIAEILGATGVIASLLYLGFQLKSNAVASSVEAKLATTRFLTDFNRDLINSPELYSLWDRGSRDSSALERDEFTQFSNLNLNAFWYLSAGHYQLRVGTLTEDDFHEMRSIMEFWLSRPGVRNWWQKHGRERFNSNFVRYVEEEMLGGTDT